MKQALVDTGPLVNFLSPRTEHHKWVAEQFAALKPPLLTCEGVITEAAFLLKRNGADPNLLLGLLESGAIAIDFRLSDQHREIRVLMRRYFERPMSFADACLVRMSEMHGALPLLTLDSDFFFYRRFGNKVIPTLFPD